MDIAPASTGAASGPQIQAEYQARVLKMQKDEVSLQGRMALDLIQSAATATGVGQQLNISI